jgi:hypothetical protein
LSREVVEGGRVVDLAVVEATRQVGDAVRDGVPGAVAFVGRAVRGRINGLAALDEGVEVDHVKVVLEESDGLGAADGGREGGDCSEGSSLRHDDGLSASVNGRDVI